MLGKIKKRISRGLPPEGATTGIQRQNSIRCAFMALCLQRQNIGFDDEYLLKAVQRHLEINDADIDTANTRKLLRWLQENLTRVTLKEKFEKEYAQGRKRAIHTIVFQIKEEERKAKAERQKESREREKERRKEKNRLKTQARAKKKAQERYQREVDEREKYDKAHPYIVAHKIRLTPTKTQQQFLQESFKVAVTVYNWALDQWEANRQRGIYYSHVDLRHMFDQIRDEQFPDVDKAGTAAKNTAFRYFGAAQAKFFQSVKKGETPRPPRRKRNEPNQGSLYIAKRWGEYVLDYDVDRPWLPANPRHPYLRIPDLGCIKMTEPIRFNGRVSGVTVKLEHDGHYYACFNIHIDRKEWKAKHPKTNLSDEPIGLDIGVKHFATLSNGLRIDNPRHFRKTERRERLLNRKCQRSRKRNTNPETGHWEPSRNYIKSRIRLGKIKHYESRCRRDFLHKFTSLLTSRYRNIGIENINTEGLLHQRHGSRYLADVAPCEFRILMEQKAKMRDINLCIADRYFPSTRTCSQCGCIGPKLPPDIRIFHCPDCGLTIDRDLNAAINLKRIVGLGESEDKSVDSPKRLSVFKKNGIAAHEVEAES